MVPKELRTVLKTYVIIYPVQFGEGALPVLPADKTALYVGVLSDGSGSQPLTLAQLRELFPAKQYRRVPSGYFFEGRLYEAGGDDYRLLTEQLTRSLTLLSGATPAKPDALPESPTTSSTTVLGAPSVSFQTPVGSVARWMLLSYVLATVSVWFMIRAAGG